MVSREVCKRENHSITKSKGILGLGLGGRQEFSEYTVVKIKLADNFPYLGIPCYINKDPLFSQCDVLLGTDVIGKGKPLGLAFPNNSDPVLYFNPTFEQGSLEVERPGLFEPVHVPQERNAYP